MSKMFSGMVTVTCALLLSHCSLTAPDRAVFSEGEWMEVEEPDLVGSSFTIVAIGDSFYLEDRQWTDIIKCTDTCGENANTTGLPPAQECFVCSSNRWSSFAKGTFMVTTGDMVVFSGIATDSLFGLLSDNTGKPVPFRESYLYTWSNDTILLLRGSGLNTETRKMVKE